MRVLGIDPGLTRCGVGVIESGPGGRVRLCHVEVVRTPATDDLAQRLLVLADAFEAALAQHRPDVVAVERVFSQHNVRTVMGTAQVSGLALAAAARAGVPVALRTPSEVKAAVTGSGVAGKEQVAQMVTRVLRLTTTPRPADASDALALALCQLWRGPAELRLSSAARAATAGTS